MWRAARIRRRHATLARRELPAPLAAYLAAPLAEVRTPWREVEYLSVDVETTGLDPQRDALLSIGWAVVRGARVRLDTATSLLVKPDTGVGRSATIHGLTDTMVAAGVGVERALEALLAALRGRVLLVHYARLDVGLIERLCAERYGAAPPAWIVDTLALESRRRHHQARTQSLRLGDLRAAYNLPHYGAHNCLTDAIATAELFLAMTASRPGSERLTLRDLLC